MRDLFKSLLVMGIFWLCRFIDWRERRDQRYLVLEHDW